MLSKKIVVVDHDRSFSEFCRARLEKEEAEVYIVPTGAEALTLLPREPFDLLLMEMWPSDMDSLAILRQLREVGVRLPVIIASEQTDVPLTWVATALELGVTSFLEKPCKAEILGDTVNYALAQTLVGTVRGDLRDFSLSSLISTICNEGRKASLKIWHSLDEATLFFEKGEIVHAALDNVWGEEAVYKALSWGEGEFVLTTGEATPERTIQGSWSSLVFEGLRRVDETAFGQEELFSTASSSIPEAPEVSDFSWPDSLADTETPQETARSVFEISEQAQLQVETHLKELHQKTSSKCVLFIHNSGRLLHLEGTINEHNRLPLAGLVAGGFSATNGITELLNDSMVVSDEAHQSLQEGSRFSIYSAEVGTNWILSAAFDPIQTKLGLVRQLTKQVAETLGETMTQDRANVGDRQKARQDLNNAFRQDVRDALGDLFGNI